MNMRFAMSATGWVLQGLGVVAILAGFLAGVYITGSIVQISDAISAFGATPGTPVIGPQVTPLWIIVCTFAGLVIGLTVFGIGVICHAQVDIAGSSERSADALESLVARRAK